MHWFALGSRSAFAWFSISLSIGLRLGLVALFLPLIRGFNSSRIPLLAVMFVRQFA